MGHSAKPPFLSGLLAIFAMLFGGVGEGGAIEAQDLSRRVSEAVSLSIERSVDSLPPMVAQGLVWRLNDDTDRWEMSELVGPTVLRSPFTIGSGSFALRVAQSRTHSSWDTGEVPFLFEPEEPSQPYRNNGSLYTSDFFSGFRSRAEFTSWITQLGATLGIGSRFDISVNIPIVVSTVDASAQYTSGGECEPEGRCLNLNSKAVSRAVGASFTKRETWERGTSALAGLNDRLAVTRLDDFDGSAGLGRVDIDGRYVLLATGGAAVSMQGGVRLPSPSVSSGAGVDSFAITPRIVASGPLIKNIRGVLGAGNVAGFLDAGVVYDFSYSSLSNFNWNAGMSYGEPHLSMDWAIGGAEYFDPIQVFPDKAPYSFDKIYAFENVSDNQFVACRPCSESPTGVCDKDGNPVDAEKLRETGNCVLAGGGQGVTRAIAPRKFETGTSFVNAKLGLKVRPWIDRGLVVSGGLVVPIVYSLLKPQPTLSFAIEYYF